MAIKYVTQNSRGSGSGADLANAKSLASYNAGTLSVSAGDTVNFDPIEGDFTAQVVIQNGGGSGTRIIYNFAGSTLTYAGLRIHVNGKSHIELRGGTFAETTGFYQSQISDDSTFTPISDVVISGWTFDSGVNRSGIFSQFGPSYTATDFVYENNTVDNVMRFVDFYQGCGTGLIVRNNYARSTQQDGQFLQFYGGTISSITRSGSTATVTTASPHNYTTGWDVMIRGADQPEYNNSNNHVTITVTGASTFTYTVSGTPATPATGTMSTFVHAAFFQVDLLFIGGAVGPTVEGNNFICRSPSNVVPQNHADCLQSFNGASTAPTGWTIRYNRFEMDTTGDEAWITMEDWLTNSDVLKLYGNIFIGGSNSSNNGINVAGDVGANARMYMYNNTVLRLTNPANTWRLDNVNIDLYWRNNITWSPSSVASTVYFGVGGSTPPNEAADWNYNFFYNCNDITAQQTGANGSDAIDPTFENTGAGQYWLGAGSPLIGQGDNTIGSEYEYGLQNGCTWPNPTLVQRTGSWDPGAYVSSSAPPADLPPVLPRLWFFMIMRRWFRRR